MAESHSGIVQVNGTQLYVEQSGHGLPLVFLHGFGLDRRMWDAQTAFFSRHFRVIRYDLRGFGQSPPTQSGYSHAADLQTLLDTLAIERTHVVGLSMGGGVAADFAIAYPNSVAGLVLVDAAVDGQQWSQSWRERWRSITAAAQAGDLATARSRWLAHPLFAPARTQAAVLADLQTMVDGYSGWHWQEGDAEIRTPQRTFNQVGKIQAPTLILVGEEDLDDFHTVAAQLEATIPDATKVILPQVGHMANMEATEIFNQIVLDFLPPAAD